ncbi:YjfB family protein [Clostridium oryzae]|uniref:Motility protein n=1 Tax=Clostridium oryzae TaxID=1450648 RepID=A0A1V4IGC9_9CLOT|nr:YjfB family protein [Clostridium oryzae]OPJ59052.1 hypothetical protein CLORY_34670 [Clostridium oryzae]
MDISQLTSMANQTSISDVIGISLLKKSMDSFAQTSTNMTEMLAASVDPNLGKNLDGYA